MMLTTRFDWSGLMVREGATGSCDSVWRGAPKSIEAPADNDEGGRSSVNFSDEFWLNSSSKSNLGISMSFIGGCDGLNSMESGV